jgi:arginase family enzyme
LENISLSLDLFQRVGGCDPRTELLIKDYIRNVLLEEKLRPALPGRVEYPVSDRALALGYRPNAAQLRKIGKEAVRIYQQRHGHKPIQREQFVAGATRMVNVYSEADVDVLDEAIAFVMGAEKR